MGVLRRLWAARSFFGGLLAIGLAWLAQNALIFESDSAAATRYYIAAIVLLLVSLTHPSLSWIRRRMASRRAPSTNEIAIVNDGSTSTENPITEPSEGDANTPASHITTSLPTRTARSRNLSPSENGSVATADDTRVSVRPDRRSLAGRWERWNALRARLGWRLVAPLAALTIILIVASITVLMGDITAPLGGWLWAASIASLIVTALVAPVWRRGDALLPDFRSDFFGPGVPILRARWEALLVGLILVVSVVLRLINLEYHPGIFGDEGERGMDARAIVEGRPSLIFGVGWWEVPNFYFYLTAFFLRIFGDHNMVADRMLSVVSGVLAVWFVYRTGRLLWGPRVGLIAGAMMAVSPLALQFSRLAGESTPTGTLWAMGFFYMAMALRFRKWSDWALAGFFWGFSLYFYAAGKLIIPLIAALGFYCLVRWRFDFFKRYALGFALLGVVFVLTGLPYGIFSQKQNWLNFTARAQQTSIFTRENQQITFSRFGLPYDPSLASGSTTQSLMAHPGAWAQLLYHQVRETTDVLYRRPDQVIFYHHAEHGGTMFPPLWAGIVMLGLAYATWKLWDPRYALVSLWFWFGMLGSALTMDAPNLQRITGAWPALMLLPAALLDRVFAGAWPLNLKLARKWATVPLAAGLLWLGADSYHEYFVHYASTCPYCVPTVQARYVASLGQEYKGYQMGVGGYDVYINYGSTRFLAKGVEGADVLAAPNELPVTTNKGAAFIIYPNNYEYLPIIRLLYPGGKEEVKKGVDGSEIFTSYEVRREQMDAFRTVQAGYAPADGGPIFVREEPRLGTAPPGSVSTGTALPQRLSYPVTATWKGGLIAPEYSTYVFSLSGNATDVKLEIDGRVMQTGLSNQGQPVEIVLAKGLHQIAVSGVLADPQARLEVRWSSGGSVPEPVDRRYLYNGPNGGLSGEIAPLSPTLGAGAVTADDPFGGQARTSRRSDLFIGFRLANPLFGDSPFMARWHGKLKAEVEGDYTFSITPGQVLLLIDGKPVIGEGAAGGGTVRLTKGEHEVDLRYAHMGGPARIEWSWRPPDGDQALVPPTVLLPAARSWLRSELADAPAGQPLPPTEDPSIEHLTPEAIIGGGLVRPRGLAVDKKGNIYVGDRGNHRIVVFSPDGKVAHTWGKQAPPPQEGQPPKAGPGEFNEINDVAVLEDAGGAVHVYVLDNTPRVQVFTGSGEHIGSYEPEQLGLYGPNGISVGVEGTEGKAYLAVASTGQNRIARYPAINEVKEGRATLPQDQQSITVSEGDTFEQPVEVVTLTSPDGAPIFYMIDLKDRVAEVKRKEGGGEWGISRQWRVPVGRDDSGSRLAISPDGKTIYMSDPDKKRVAVIELETGDVRYFVSAGEGLGGPTGIAVGADGKVYVLDREKANVQVFTITK
jgi:DNA-binding beta-propeller fold protein YncE/4-amino-4-deoxy-L-arabinose transferase-like glycosyltransferase